jgi:MFS family permease
MLSCAPLIVSAAHPPLEVVLAAWMLSGIGGAYQITAAAAFVQSLPGSGRARAFGLAQSGLLAAQGLGILIGGAAARPSGRSWSWPCLACSASRRPRCWPSGGQASAPS